ncbi:hypothetical protein NQ314_000722 [Rhamnusium bicolor]|uniref:Uncharacterized protein n=1 Tax=Rhamnusium bicolor TaxID=1586634 RepID=A0AAV8ZXA6_9CUCU|nr:hypothetical protein NQ314_000722 [Rhamnusium bicolor]
MDSFGGNDEENATPEKPRNGFYFLLDWNTFLEVDDQNGRRVNLRLQPKVGNPKQFFDVTAALKF